jgi:hypothetical protein
MKNALARTLAITLLLGACTDGRGASVSSEDYAVTYDYTGFRAATDGKEFPVLIAGNPFPDLTAEETDRRLLPVMQANKPRPRLRFTLEGPQSDHRLVLVFNPSSEDSAAKVCKGDVTVGPAVPGRVNVFAVYCRNDLPLSQAIGRTAATGPDDPAVARLFSDLFQTVFTDAPVLQPDRGYPGGLR